MGSQGDPPGNVGRSARFDKAHSYYVARAVFVRVAGPLVPTTRAALTPAWAIKTLVHWIQGI